MNVGWNSSDRTNASGSHRMITTTFQPAMNAMSKWITCIGLRRNVDSWPCLIRSSQAHGVSAMFMFRTSVQTM